MAVHCTDCKHFNPDDPHWERSTGICMIQLPPWIERRIDDLNLERGVNHDDSCDLFERSKG